MFAEIIVRYIRALPMKIKRGKKRTASLKASFYRKDGGEPFGVYEELSRFIGRYLH